MSLLNNISFPNIDFPYVNEEDLKKITVEVDKVLPRILSDDNSIFKLYNNIDCLSFKEERKPRLMNIIDLMEKSGKIKDTIEFWRRVAWEDMIEFGPSDGSQISNANLFVTRQIDLESFIYRSILLLLDKKFLLFNPIGVYNEEIGKWEYFKYNVYKRFSNSFDLRPKSISDLLYPEWPMKEPSDTISYRTLEYVDTSALNEYKETMTTALGVSKEFLDRNDSI